LASESTPPPPPSGGGRYAIIGVVLFAIAALAYCMTSGGDQAPPTPPPAGPPDAGTADRSTALVEDSLVIPDPEPDSGPVVDAGAPRPTRRLPGTGTGPRDAWESCTGDIPRAEAARVIHDFNTQIRNCYERQLKQNPALQGNLTVDLMIAPDGRVEGTRLAGTLRDRDVFACVRSVTSHMRFPAPGGRDCAVVQAPFSFTPRE